jgi:hypothetical protein
VIQIFSDEKLLRDHRATIVKVIGVNQALPFTFSSSLLVHSFTNIHIAEKQSRRQSSNHFPGITIHEPIRGIPQGRGSPRAPPAGTITMLEAENDTYSLLGRSETWL